MAEQATLPGLEVDELAKHPRLALGLEAIRVRGPIAKEWVAAAWHAHRGVHRGDVLCRFCESDGRAITASLEKRGLVRKTAEGWVDADFLLKSEEKPGAERIPASERVSEYDLGDVPF